MKILLFSAYDAASHRYWRAGLVAAFPDWQWTVLTLPARHFSWRVRGNPLSWMALAGEELMADYDLVIATSMTDLATLRGLNPGIADVPAVLYFHENQFAYPDMDPYRLLESQMVSIYSALAATICVFNSEYNRSTFLEGVRGLLDQLPDKKPKNLHGLLNDRSQVLPVPLNAANASPTHQKPDPARPVLLWNHRWEHDKGPQILLQALRTLAMMQQDFELVLCGQRFRECPPALLAVCEEFAPQISHNAYVKTEAEYYGCLRRSDIVISTALQEFQGLAVMQAVQQGCIPLVPDRLCYPEFFSPVYRYNSADGDSAVEGVRLAEHLCGMIGDGSLQPPRLDHLGWKQMAPKYHELMTAAVAARRKK